MFSQFVHGKNLFSNFPEKFELQFYNAFRDVKALGCDYFYFLGISSEGSYRFCTNEDWVEFYLDEKFNLHDPLKRAAEGSNFIVLPWDQVTHLHGDDKRTMYGRISFGLYNGLTISREFQKKKYIFALATESKEHDLARYLVLEKVEALEKFVRNCMRIFDQFVLLISNHTEQIMQ